MVGLSDCSGGGDKELDFKIGTFVKLNSLSDVLFKHRNPEMGLIQIQMVLFYFCCDRITYTPFTRSDIR